jgi:iron complex outermembrane receptor protein
VTPTISHHGIGRGAVARLLPILTLACCITLAPGSAARALAADPPDTMIVEQPEIVVSATRTRRSAVEVPGSVSVITGAEMRRRGIRTMAEALQDLTGIDTGEGSDNGGRVPNVGMWGLKEFDALLFTINGVPAGGPFNPSLSQIPVENVERIEIVKGPQGTMYGVSAFAGMVSVFTNDARAGGEVAAGGGSFSQGHGHFSWGKSLAEDRLLQITGSFARSDGWQDRTESNVFRGGATLDFGLGKTRNTLDLVGYNDEQDWGTPLPFDQGQLVSGFKIDRNYAIQGAEVKHQVFGGTLRSQMPLGEHRIENTLGLTSDSQDYLRSFTREVIPPDTLVSTALELDPTETSLYEDLRLVAHFQGAGTHEAVFGTALTWGETKGEAHEFEFDQLMNLYPEIPATGDAGETHDFEDRRTFFGVYAHDAWTPTWRVTLEGGARLDFASEELETEADIAGVPTKVTDSREDNDVSGDLAALVRLLPEGGANRIQTMNLYGSVRRGFKPAAPNLAEAEAAVILEPEHTTSWEVGLKTRAFEEVAVDLSYFDMTFENMVVSILGPGGGPQFTNAGEERFKGFEADVRWAPKALAGTSIDVGYAHHDAKFVDFTFVTPDSQFRDVSGKHLELVPQDLVNTRVNLRLPAGVGAWAAMRYQGERPFNRRNTFFAEAYTEWDAGASWNRDRWRISVVGRNLTDDRHVVTESEIGDAQFYVAPPARVTAEIAYRF